MQEKLNRDPELQAIYEESRVETQLGYALATFRQQRGMSERALADASGIAQPMINRIEKGAQAPTVPTLMRLLRALNATAELGQNGIEIRPVADAAIAVQPAPLKQLTWSDIFGAWSNAPVFGQGYSYNGQPVPGILMGSGLIAPSNRTPDVDWSKSFQVYIDSHAFVQTREQPSIVGFPELSVRSSLPSAAYSASPTSASSKQPDSGSTVSERLALAS